MTRPSLSLVVPARDEAANIADLLTQAKRVLPQLTKEHEVIVVDDGSLDATGEIARRFPGVRVVSHRRNFGYGAALRTGLRAAHLEWIFFTDADLQFAIEDLVDLIEASRDCDIVCGRRSPRRDPVLRRLLGWSWSRLVRALFDVPVSDVDCAFKLLHRRVIEAIPIQSVGAFVNTEILARAHALGFRIREVPVRHYPRVAGYASGARPRVILRALIELGQLRRQLR